MVLGAQVLTEDGDLVMVTWKSPGRKTNADRKRRGQQDTGCRMPGSYKKAAQRAKEAAHGRSLYKYNQRRPRRPRSDRSGERGGLLLTEMRCHVN